MDVVTLLLYCFVAVAVVAWITCVCVCITCATVCIFLCVKILDPKRVSATDNYKAHLPSSERSHQLRKKRINTTLFLSFALDPWSPAPAGNISPHLPSDQCTFCSSVLICECKNAGVVCLQIVLVFPNRCILNTHWSSSDLKLRVYCRSSECVLHWIKLELYRLVEHSDRFLSMPYGFEWRQEVEKCVRMCVRMRERKRGEMGRFGTFEKRQKRKRKGKASKEKD